MDQTLVEMGDPDGNFIDEFQGPGFHSRLFELACFAYLRESGWTVDRGQVSPDFLVTKGNVRLAIEAVTSNSSLGRETDIAVSRMVDPRTEDILAKCNEEFPIRMGGALQRKLEKRYWERPPCRGLPFVLIIGPFHEAGSTTYVDESLSRYLFGIERFTGWVERSGILVRQAPVASHSFGGRTITSNFFASPEAENVSAVVWCNQFTVPRFFRLAAESRGVPSAVNAVEVQTTRYGVDGTSLERFTYEVGDPAVPPETWSRGTTVFLNPNALVPLPDELVERTSTFSLRDGRLVRDLHGMHTLTSFMVIRGARP